MGEGAKAVEDAPILYELDYHLWCFTQADTLRRRRFSRADLPNIIEELESSGRSQRSALRSSYRLLIAHLLRWQFRPERRSTSWNVTIVRERSNVAELEEDNPSLKADAPELLLGACPKARREAHIGTGLPLSAFPAACPYPLEFLRDPAKLPE